MKIKAYRVFCDKVQHSCTVEIRYAPIHLMGCAATQYVPTGAKCSMYNVCRIEGCSEIRKLMSAHR